MANQAKEEIKGVISPADEKTLGKAVDKLADFKNPILEAVDGPAFALAVKTFDNLVLDQLPEKIKAEMREYIPEIIKAL